ncbi:MAG: CDP-diacylglycerol--glycerol-3-phosphate 3-phosphatidyltransferase [Verrucomicrobiota bacterium]
MNLPNRLTCARLVLCLLLAFVFSLDTEWRGSAALVIFVIASLTDWLDGYLARKWNQITDLGKLLDPLADKVLVSIGYIGLVSEDMCAVWILSLIISREFLITGLRVLAAAKGAILAAERIGKHKTISQMVALSVGLFLLAFLDLGLEQYWIAKLFASLLDPLLWLTVVITVYSGLAYFMKNRSLLAE